MNGDDIGAAFILVVLFILSIMGLAWLIDAATSTTLNHQHWQCTQAVVVEGKAECVKWEKK